MQLPLVSSPLQVHHEKELEHLKRMMDRKEDDLLKNQTLERKALPKRIRQEMKAREQMFRASMRISVTNLNEVMNPTEEKDRLKKVRTGGRQLVVVWDEIIIQLISVYRQTDILAKICWRLRTRNCLLIPFCYL